MEVTEIDLGVPGLVDLKRIGAGGFATVYEGFETEASRTVAVKVLAAMDPSGRRRFDRERQIMGQTSAHDNIVTMFRSGYTDPGQRPYLVMEHMPGGSLQDRLDNEGRLGIDEALQILLPVIDGLGFAHSTGIVHKDVKPANILISATGSPKLSDFGIASIRDTTGTGQMAFSLLYTPPETFDATTGPTGETSDPRDERSDLYSVAATLYTLITGTPLFWADSQAALMRQILTEPPPRTGDPTLDGFLARALAKDPDQRFHTADQLSTAFQTIQQQGRANPLISPLTVKDSAPYFDSGQPSAEVPPQSEPDWRTQATGPSPLTNTPSVGTDHQSVQPVQSQPFVRSAEPANDEWQRQNVTPADRGKGRTPILAIVTALTALVALVLLGAFLVLGRDDTPTDTIASPAVTDETTTTVAPDTTAAPTTEAPTTLPEIPEPVVYTGHSDLVWSVVELSDGRIASGGPDNTVHVWDADDAESTQATYTGHTDTVVAVLGLSDGRIASAGWGSTVHIWDPADPDAPAELYTGHQRGVEALVELSDGRVASAATDATVQIWDPADY